jgi:hypothetical protein
MVTPPIDKLRRGQVQAPVLGLPFDALCEDAGRGQLRAKFGGPAVPFSGAKQRLKAERLDQVAIRPERRGVLADVPCP